jgi:hypothetical protein
MQIESLHIQNMNVLNGGSVRMMHDTIIQEVGLHQRILQVGNKQAMHLIKGADSPFWMMPAQRLETKHLRTAKSRAKTKIKLLKELRQSGYNTTKQRYLKEDLVALYGPRNISITAKEQKVKEGGLESQKECSRYYGSMVGSTPAK